MTMDGNTRLLIVGGAAALAVYFAWPYFRGEMGEVGRQLSGNHADAPRMFDPFGVMPKGDGRGEGDNAERPRRRMRLPEGLGDGDVGPEDRQERYPRMAPPDRYQDRGGYPGQERSYGRGERYGSAGGYERYYQEGPRQFRRCPDGGCPPAPGWGPRTW
jgi:hypothetical protein